MIRNTFLRRLVTIPIVYLLLALMTALLPALMAAAVLVDIGRWLSDRTPWVGVRMLLFSWVYLIGEAWAIVALGAVALLPRSPELAATYRLQMVWAGWNLEAVRILFGLEMVVEGAESVVPGPIVILSRHASLIDTLIPANFVTRPHGVRLRYVLKRELLLDPAIDIAGNRLVNAFIDRAAGDSKSERAAIRTLASGMGEDDGILIYPEGTRYSDAKREKYVSRLVNRDGAVGDIARGLRRVLPPRPGGTLALLEATAADVVVLAHRGLEGFARVKDIWSGGLVGSTVNARFWRVPRSDIPEERGSRVEWLFSVWSEIDEWVTTGSRQAVEGT